MLEEPPHRDRAIPLGLEHFFSLYIEVGGPEFILCKAL